MAFEGIDGSGKSTQIQRLAQRLAARGIPCCCTREPTDAPIGSLIHQIMTGRMEADHRVIASLFAADRLDHLLNKTDGILQRLQEGMAVITDRYYFSSYAYHSVDADMDWVIQTNSQSASLLRPDRTIFLDMPVQTALERIGVRGQHRELFEREDRLTAVREKYFEAFARQRELDQVVILDASGDADSIADSVWEAVRPLFDRQAK